MADGVGRFMVDPDDFPDWYRHPRVIENVRDHPTGNPARCYHIHVDYIPALLTLVDYYCYPSAHQGDQATRAQQASWWCALQILLMTGNIDCEGEMALLKFRQSSADPCVLEVSYDGGQSWGTMFDYGLCFREGMASNNVVSAEAFAQVNVFVHERMSVYDETVGSIAPNLVHDETGDDNYRDLAMCLLVHNLVRQTSAAGLAYNERREGWFWDIQRFHLKTTSWILDRLIWLSDTFLDIPIIPETILMQQLKEWNDATLDYLSEQDLDAFKDAAILQEIHCFAFLQLEGQTVNEADFTTMFNGVSAVTGVSSEMEEWLVTGVNSREVYVGAMTLLDELPAQLESGLVEYSCPCSEWYEDIDLTLNNGGFVAYGNDPATWISGSGWRSNPTISRCNLEFAQAAHVSEMRVDYTISETASSPAAHAAYGLYNPLTICDEPRKIGIEFGNTEPGSYVISVSGGLAGVTGCGFSVGQAQANAVLVTRIRLWGSGPNPFV